MFGFVGKIVMKKIFKEKNPSKPQEDPYYNKVPTKTMGFSHTKREKKPLPAGLTAQEEKVLKKTKARAYALDMCFVDKGPIKLGWSSVIGLIPGFGDVIDFLLALFVYRTCCSVEPPLESSVKLKMKMNLVIDFVIGLIPIIGDLADAAYKCNTKNAILLEETLVERAKLRKGGARPDPRIGDVGVHGRDEGGDHPPPRSTKQPRRPEPAYDPSVSDERGSYFGGRTEVDLEAGEGTPHTQSTRDQGLRSHQHRGREDRR